MNTNSTRPQGGKQGLLVIVLTIVFGSALALFLLLISGWLFIYVAAAVLAIALLALVHYALWGRRQPVGAGMPSRARRDRDAGTGPVP